MNKYIPDLDFRRIYDHFASPVIKIDCGQKCAPYNKNGKPFCCDICEAVPAAFHVEWQYLQKNTNLWHEWRGDECITNPEDPSIMLSETPEHQTLLACLGPAYCQRNYRAVSCRQFPFIPYVTADYRFLGLTYEWHFEQTCWVISNLNQVTSTYRSEFISLFDELFALWQEEFDSYAILSEQMREHFLKIKRRIPILHRNGGYFLLSPGSEHLARVSANQFKKFGPYK